MATRETLNGLEQKLQDDLLRLECHPVAIALSKARAMTWLLEQLGAPDGENSLVHALEDATAPEETRQWLRTVVADALRAAIADAATSFRKVAGVDNAVDADAWLRRQLEGLGKEGE
jgi:hypothetical protein